MITITVVTRFWNSYFILDIKIIIDIFFLIEKDKVILAILDKFGSRNSLLIIFYRHWVSE